MLNIYIVEGEFQQMYRHGYVSTDTPTTFAHPGWRSAYTLVSWIILGITLSTGNSLFVGLMMLACGLFFDYAKFTPVSKFRFWSKVIGCWWAGILFIVNLSAAFGAATVENIENQPYFKVASFPFFSGSMFPVKWYWLVTGLSVLFTCIDWIAEVREAERTGATSPAIKESAATTQVE
ncbi:hypothetical protein P4S95_17725 [Aneurinibacillus aneurinilyticus]|uniref:hypothetical protein n=1 Tax=Aneurinibacillus aneurinilyticus TaxID=1391 RepID=UPI002E24B717|nr:hypothetical protein [Aneurinibacillus aneurinilyticus]